MPLALMKSEALAKLQSMAEEQAEEERTGSFRHTSQRHVDADAILCGLLRQLDMADIVDAYEALDKWYE